jgi:integrase
VRDLTYKQILALKPGRHWVSDSLYVKVSPDGRKRRFLFRYTKPSTRKVSEKSTGLLDKEITLADAKEKRDEYHKLVRQGGDPVEAKREARVATVTFADMAADYLKVAERRFRNPGSTKNVRLMLTKHASALADMPISGIGATHINAALRPLWLESPDQARRTIAAVLRVLTHAKAQGLETASVGDLRDNMRDLFPPVKGEKQHFKALNYADIPCFVRELRAAQTQGEAKSPALIEFIVLTVVRVGEAVGVRWGEIDWNERVWTIPANRMKAGRTHRVPLCDRAFALLMRQRGPNAFGEEPDPNSYIWPGRNGTGHITAKAAYKFMTQTMDVDATIHGLRASFRTWSGNETNFDRVTCELALAHAAGDAVELAYRRGDALAKRRQLMEAWSAYCEGR